MRTEKEVEDFAMRAEEQYQDEGRVAYYVECFEACLPKLFWDVHSKNVKRNRKAFQRVVLAASKRWKVPLKQGYGLIFCGDNGTGKTLFLSFILSQMIKRSCSVYYT